MRPLPDGPPVPPRAPRLQPGAGQAWTVPMCSAWKRCSPLVDASLDCLLSCSHSPVCLSWNLGCLGVLRWSAELRAIWPGRAAQSCLLPNVISGAGSEQRPSAGGFRGKHAALHLPDSSQALLWGTVSVPPAPSGRRDAVTPLQFICSRRWHVENAGSMRWNQTPQQLLFRRQML